MNIEELAKKLKKEDIAKVREQNLDKFYTIPEISKKCIDTVGKIYDWEWDLIVEPSAGNGSFFLQIPSEKKIGIDIEPEHKDIIKQDFLTYKPKCGGDILVIGNPPFGKVCSLAIKFFNHAAEWATVIAFIIPKTFRRISVQNRLNLHFHLIKDIDIPSIPCSFDPPMMVKCCFQIWERQIFARVKVDLPTIHDDWDFLPMGPLDEKQQPTPPISADFTIRAYGGNCGDIVTTDMDKLRPKSWHWIKSKIHITNLIENFKKLDYSISKDTARQNSIGRAELVQLYSSTLDI